MFITYRSRVKRILSNEFASAKFSVKEIVFATVNLRDAKELLAEDEYTRVYEIFCHFSASVDKKRMGKAQFVYTMSRVMACFDLVAPYYKICGNNKMHKVMSLQELDKYEYRERAKQIFQKHRLFSEEWTQLYSEFWERFYV